MFNWAKQQLANVVGTEEPEYGPSAIQPVTEQAIETPYTELKKEDLKWTIMDSTNVETHTFHLHSNQGHEGLAQIIYSNVAGFRITAQFNSKIHYPGEKPTHLWCSDQIHEYALDEEKYDFTGPECSIVLSEDGNTYTIKSEINKDCIVDLKVTRAAPGFMVGKDGTSYFGTDPANPWGRMRHIFWTRCNVEGSMTTKDGEVDFTGHGMFIHALQGMKPHHAACRWNFVDFQGPTYSAALMEYTTPRSYGSTVVSFGGIVSDGKIVWAGATPAVKHTAIIPDPENDWPEPSAISWTWKGDKFEAELSGSMGERMDRVDVMAEVPGFVKQIVAGAVGTKPYIYQYGPHLTLKIDDNGKHTEEEGQIFTEATFIS
ncbi:MAG: putative cell survival pathways protein [Bogoriella megaspora]|nr:MAG: putative cell survival pathways protein [Bogoriella megaspora]